MNGRTLTTMMLIIFLEMGFTAQAQDDGFIYGRVTTIDNDTYQGALRWGKEEVYWTDHFNTSKEENKNLEYLSNDELDYLDDMKGHRYSSSWTKWSDDWDWGDRDYIHQFSCQYGELKSLTLRSRDRVDVELQNGDIIEVDGDGYNDIGTDIKIIDSEIGEVKLSWNRIETVEFMPTPKKLDEKFGEPLYGTVFTDYGEFTGFVQWDHDERVSTDKLDGDTYDGDVSISFGKIASIERSGSSRSIIKLNSGRELELRGSNDVNSENRGIIVTIEGLGRVDIPWREFDKVEFEKAPHSGPAYSDFKDQKALEGKVTVSNGDKHSGRIVFDLDEAYNLELLHGNDDDIEYIIPFRNIKSIVPKNYDYSEITLKNGDKLVLGESQDVSEDNEGILVFNGKEPVYIPWEKVEEIEFD